MEGANVFYKEALPADLSCQIACWWISPGPRGLRQQLWGAFLTLGLRGSHFTSPQPLPFFPPPSCSHAKVWWAHHLQDWTHHPLESASAAPKLPSKGDRVGGEDTDTHTLTSTQLVCPAHAVTLKGSGPQGSWSQSCRASRAQGCARPKQYHSYQEGNAG